MLKSYHNKLRSVLRQGLTMLASFEFKEAFAYNSIITWLSSLKELQFPKL